MGVHTGVAHERDGNYFGPTLNRAARLMSAAHGGKLVVSAAVAELTRDFLGDQVAVLDLGEHSLRGLSRPERVYQLNAPGLSRVFPRLRTASTALGNLPMPATSFVGRVAQLKALSDELVSRRLVTVVGPGGVGKTRVAIEAAHAYGDLPDGVWMVELAPLGDPAAVGHAAAAALSVRPREGGDPIDAIVEALSRRRMLLVLDNAEHVVDATADLVARVLAGAPKVVVLATSRELLGLPAEQVWPLEPLEPTLEGVALFYDRAALADAEQGVYAVYLAENGFSVVAVDFVPAALIAAMRHVERAASRSSLSGAMWSTMRRRRRLSVFSTRDACTTCLRERSAPPPTGWESGWRQVATTYLFTLRAGHVSCGYRMVRDT